MEERLDDAINVLRSHCEPQLNLPIGMDAASLSGHPSFVPTQAPQSQSTNSGLNQDAAVSLPIDIPVKVERTSVPSVSSKFALKINIYNIFHVFSSTEKRKEPPDSDTKPSSSSVGGPATSKANGQKRQRR